MSETVHFPVLPDGSPVGPGDVVRLHDGTLLRVATVAVTVRGCFVSEADVEDGQKGFVSIPEHVGDPMQDDLDSVAADSELGADAYCRKRGLSAEGMRAQDRRRAMVDDLLRRQRALLLPQG